TRKILSRRLAQRRVGGLLADLLDEALPGGRVGRHLAARLLQRFDERGGAGGPLVVVAGRQPPQDRLQRVGQRLGLAALARRREGRPAGGDAAQRREVAGRRPVTVTRRRAGEPARLAQAA